MVASILVRLEVEMLERLHITPMVGTMICLIRKLPKQLLEQEEFILGITRGYQFVTVKLIP